MKDYQFVQGNCPEGFTPHFTESLFNRAEHRLLQSKQNWVSFFILNKTNKKIEASIHFYVNGEEAQSPYRAPFGSIEMVEEFPPALVADFLKFVEQSLFKLGIKKVIIKMSPLAYANTNSLIQLLFINNQFQVEAADVGTVIYVNERTFENFIKDSERQVLKQFKRKKYACNRLPIENLKQVYDFIHHHQSLKGYALSMSYEELYKTVEVFKDYFFLFVAMDGQKIIAASVSIKVTDQVLYNFYIAHDVEYNSSSPVVALIESLYIFCKENSISILDLGTSMLHGKPNFSLLDFKLRLGGVVTEKLTFSKKLV